jgi:hypothetical protein
MISSLWDRPRLVIANTGATERVSGFSVRGIKCGPRVLKDCHKFVNGQIGDGWRILWLDPLFYLFYLSWPPILAR